MGTVSKVMAGCFSMAAFAVAIVAGMTSGNPAILVLGRALVAMVLCYPVGFIVGIVCERVIALHIKDYAEKNPLPHDELAVALEESEGSEELQEQEDVLVV